MFPSFPDTRPSPAAPVPASLAHWAAQTTSDLHTRGTPASVPWWHDVADLPSYLPVFASPEGEGQRHHEQLTARIVARHIATAAAAPYAAAAVELTAHGIGVYAEKVTAQVPGRDPLELWEHVARFGAARVYGPMRSLAAAVLTARAALDGPERDAHLEGLRRHWLVDWIVDGDEMRPRGPANHPELLAELAEAVAGLGQVEHRLCEDGELRAAVWEAVAGPGPDTGLLTRRQLAGRRLMLIDPGDAYVQDRAHTMPTWSRFGPDPEQAFFDSHPSALQQLVKELSTQDCAVLCAWLEGGGTWAEAAALAVPGADAVGADLLGERVRRRLKRYGQEVVRRRAARVNGLPAGVRRGEAAR